MKDTTMKDTIPDLEEFISATLEQIVRGVKAAQESLSSRGAVVNPDIKGKAEDVAAAGIITAMEPGREVVKGDKPRKAVVRVRFDVGVAATKTDDNEWKIGVFAGSLGVGAKRAVEKGGTAEHRIQFEVPILLPSLPSGKGDS